MTGVTKDELKSYTKICESINILRREISQLEAKADIVGDTYRDYRTGTGIVKKISGVVDVKKKKKRLDELENRRETIEIFVGNISDDTTRQVIKLRYIDGETWPQVAKKMGHPDRADYYRLVVHNKFFRGMINK